MKHLMKHRFIAATGMLIAGLSACNHEEGCMDPNALNYNPDAETSDGGCIYGTTQHVPATYAFTDANGNNTVSFEGQTIRLEMLEEMTTYMKTAHTSGTAIDGQTLKNGYANHGFNWTDAGGWGMAGSGKQLKNKTAASSGIADPVVQACFEGLMEDMAVVSANTVAGNDNGAAGQAGVVVSTTNPSKKYLCSAKGMEYTQLIEKGLMGAVFYNQITGWYLAEAQMNADNQNAVDAAGGKHYTKMEHHWDEAYGYFTTATDFPANGTHRFWGKYAHAREGILSSATRIGMAFRKGRAAIVAKDYDTRDAQIAIIRKELERVAGGTAIHYLNSAVDNFTDDALRNHQLSEAAAFIQSLKYGHAPSVTIGQVDALLAALGNDFYLVTLTNIATVRDGLAAYLDLTGVKNQL